MRWQPFDDLPSVRHSREGGNDIEIQIRSSLGQAHYQRESCFAAELVLNSPLHEQFLQYRLYPIRAAEPALTRFWFFDGTRIELRSDLLHRHFHTKH